MRDLDRRPDRLPDPPADAGRRPLDPFDSFDPFEGRLRAALLAHTADAPGGFDARGFAHEVATRAPRRHGLVAALSWRPAASTPPDVAWRRGGLADRPAWVLALAALLVVALAGGVVAAGALLRTRDPARPAVVPPAMLAACPTGTDPDAARPSAQARPPYDHEGAAVAFDPVHGRLLLVADAGWTSELWALDACTNAWTRLPTAETPASDVSGLVVDTRLDTAIAIDGSNRPYTYDAAAGTWRAGTASPSTILAGLMHAFYDPVTDRVVGVPAWAQGTGDAFAWDAAADRWTRVGPGTASALALLAFDPVDGRLVVAGQPLSFLDVRTGRASSPATQPPDPGIAWGWEDPGRFQATWDPDGHRLLVLTSQGRVQAYDAAANAWSTLYDVSADPAPAGPRRLWASSVAWDTVNHRLVVYGGHALNAAGTWVRSDIVQAFDPVTGTWRVLVQPTGEWPA